MASRFNEDQVLGEEAFHSRVDAPDDDNDGDGSDDGSDDGWGDLTVDLTPADHSKKRMSCGLFVPELANVLDASSSKPPMPLLEQAQLPPGQAVWVVDEDDVQMLLKDFWDHAIRPVCNGRLSGTVVKHSGEALTVVAFADPKGRMSFSFTLPRQCLSVEKIEPYERLKKKNSLGHSIGGVGNLGPRAGRGTAKTKEDIHHLQQYYEVITANKIVEALFEPVVELLDKGKYAKALEAIEAMMEAPDTVSTYRKELLCVRSTIHLYLGNVPSALNDALEVIQINPSWIKGYLRAARAHSASGKFLLANQMINQSLLLLPHCSDISVVSDLNDALISQQMMLKSSSVSLRLDALYTKLLFPKRPFRKDEVLVEELGSIACIASLYSKDPHCTTCLNRTATMYASPAKDKRGMLYCSEACQKRSGLFIPGEVDTYAQGFKSAMTLIQNKAASSLNILPLEIAQLTIRLFFMAVALHKGGGGSNASQQPTMHNILKDHGVFPFVTSLLDNKTRDDLLVLYKVLTGQFTTAEKDQYPDTFFVQLFVFVSTYIVCAPVGTTNEFTGPQPAGSATVGGLIGYFVPQFVGGVERAAAEAEATVNCSVRCNAVGSLAIVSEADIAKEGKLIIRALKTQR